VVVTRVARPEKALEIGWVTQYHVCCFLLGTWLASERARERGASLVVSAGAARAAGEIRLIALMAASHGAIAWRLLHTITVWRTSHIGPTIVLRYPQWTPSHPS
jgi:hypothetical protein